MSLTDILRAHETKMIAVLEEARARLDHGGSKGTIVEAAVRGFLREYLPSNLGVGHGEVIDTYGARSGQIDVVIASDDHPFTYTQDSPGLFFIEGVLAAGEVKSVLDGSALDRALQASLKFKRLRNRPSDKDEIFANPSDARRWHVNPPFFLFALESRISFKSIGKKIVQFELDHGISPPGINAMLDSVYVLRDGWLVNFGDGKGATRWGDSDGTVREPGWRGRKSQHVLFDLLGWLSGTMPRSRRWLPVLLKYLETEQAEQQRRPTP